MNESIGDFRELEGGGARVSLVFYPGDFAVRWSQCSATADFFAEYFAAVDACRRDDDEAARSEFIGTVSYIVNELVENAVKFSVGETVEVTVVVRDDELVALVTNQILAATVEALIDKFRELVSGDPQEMLFARVEANAENPESGASGLGFLTMMSDYGAKLGWRFDAAPDNPYNVLLKTMARLQVRNQ
jgi:hypothetical protein